MLTDYPRIPQISVNIQLFSEIVNDICSQIFLRDACPVPISKTQLSILKTLYVSGNKSATDLSELLHFSRPAISQQVDKLKKLRLVSRKIDTEDRRAVSIDLTKTGRQIIETYEEYILARHANVLNYFSYEERQIFNSALERFIHLCLENVDNLDILCLNCNGKFAEFCQIHLHKHICHLEQKQSAT